MAQQRRLVLASTSAYRRALLSRLGLSFDCVPPQVDESALTGERPHECAARLALAKARDVAAACPGAIVIGSDQVAELDQQWLGKPGSHENAVRQLRMASGRTVHFHTAVSVCDAERGAEQTRVIPCRVTFRTLADAQIEDYLRRERPYDCAGSAKVEGLGIALIERIETEDPTSLIGLPLIALTELLARAGMPVLS